MEVVIFWTSAAKLVFSSERVLPISPAIAVILLPNLPIPLRSTGCAETFPGRKANKVVIPNTHEATLNKPFPGRISESLLFIKLPTIIIFFVPSGTYSQSEKPQYYWSFYILRTIPSYCFFINLVISCLFCVYYL